MKPVKWTSRLLIRFMRQGSSRRVHPDTMGTVRLVDTRAEKTRVIIFQPKEGYTKPLPVYVNMHGGGFVMGDAEGDNPSCEAIANAVGCRVVNIDYKLAPEYRFSVALEECYDVVKWIHDHADELQVDRNRIAIGGHSAGGNLAAAVCLLARQHQEFSIVYQILDYPPLDLSRDPATKTRVPPGSKVIPRSMARLFDECYIGSYEAAKNPLVSPVYAQDVAGMPPALIITAEQDYLAEEAEIYAGMLATANVAVMYKQFPGVEHGFTFSDTEQAREAWQLIYQQLRTAFSRQEDAVKPGQENNA